MLFIPLAVALALFNRKHDHLLLNTIVGVALLIVCIAVGIYCPIYFSKNLWLVVVFAYIFIASVAPVWILLQSRDYLNSFLLYFMIAAAVIGVVFTNPSMEIEETGGANFLFVTKSGKVVTPKSDSILPSVTRHSLLYVAEHYLGLPVEERPIYKDELTDMAEAGLCGTAAVICPVGKIVDHGTEIVFPSGMTQMGPVTQKLYDTLTAIQQGRIQAPAGWIHKIPV